MFLQKFSIRFGSALLISAALFNPPAEAQRRGSGGYGGGSRVGYGSPSRGYTPPARSYPSPRNAPPARNYPSSSGYSNPGRTYNSTARTYPSSSGNTSAQNRNYGGQNYGSQNYGARNGYNSGSMNRSTTNGNATNPQYRNNANQNRPTQSMGNAGYGNQRYSTGGSYSNQSTVTRGGAIKTQGVDGKGRSFQNIQHTNGTTQRITRNNDGTMTTRSFDRNGNRISSAVKTPNGTVRYDANNRVTYRENRSMNSYTRTYGNGRTYRESYGTNASGYRTVTRSGWRGNSYYSNRTYVYNNYRYGSGFYSVYHPYYGGGWYGAAFYHPFYSPMWSPFGIGNPFYYSWGWYSSPWYAHYGYYYHPYQSYLSLSAWIVDYTVSSYLAEQYANANAQVAAAQAQTARAQADAAQAQAELAAIEARERVSQQSNVAPPPQQSLTQNAAITDEMKDALKAQTEAEMRARANTDENQRTVSIASKLSNPDHVYIVSRETNATTEQGDKCSLTPGDLIKAVNDPATKIASVTVIAAKSNDCEVGSVVTLSTQDLVEFDNDNNSKLDEAAEKAKRKKIVKN